MVSLLIRGGDGLLHLRLPECYTIYVSVVVGFSLAEIGGSADVFVFGCCWCLVLWKLAFFLISC
jgi:hypothetical protein